jgi:uncharacterized protein
VRRLHPWLGLVALVVAVCGIDTMRPAQQQVLVRGYAECIGAYQWAKPRLGIAPCCRFVPSCSRYSVEAVQCYGLRNGLKLTFDRLNRCRSNVHFGTLDPLTMPGNAPLRRHPFNPEKGRFDLLGFRQNPTQ